jgi:hypothetical protein
MGSSVAGRGGIHSPSAGFALKPQGFLDAPHIRTFLITVSSRGEKYFAAIRYRFTVSETIALPACVLEFEGLGGRLFRVAQK